MLLRKNLVKGGGTYLRGEKKRAEGKASTSPISDWKKMILEPFNPTGGVEAIYSQKGRGEVQFF